MPELERVCVFCGSSAGHDPRYAEAAAALGSLLAQRGVGLVYGGGAVGLMGVVADAVLDAGGEVTGVIPGRLSDEVGHERLTELVVVDGMHARKALMYDRADAFVALPGGFGTLDESFELLTLLQTGKTYLAPVVLLDAPGGTYWQGWRTFVQDQLMRDGLISPDDLAFVYVTDSVQAAVDELCGFYTTYHSMRFVGRRLVLRLQRSLSDDELAVLNDDFGDIVATGSIAPVEASAAEVRDRDHVDLPRIAFEFNRRDYARLRQLIDAINGRPD